MGATVAPDPPPIDPEVLLRDAAYTAIGFAVLGFQRLQLVRRDLGRQVRAGLEVAVPAVRTLTREVEAAADPVLDRIEASLPDPGRFVLRSARVTARTLLH